MRDPLRHSQGLHSCHVPGGRHWPGSDLCVLERMAARRAWGGTPLCSVWGLSKGSAAPGLILPSAHQAAGLDQCIHLRKLKAICQTHPPPQFLIVLVWSRPGLQHFVKVPRNLWCAAGLRPLGQVSRKDYLGHPPSPPPPHTLTCFPESGPEKGRDPPRVTEQTRNIATCWGRGQAPAHPRSPGPSSWRNTPPHPLPCFSLPLWSLCSRRKQWVLSELPGRVSVNLFARRFSPNPSSVEQSRNPLPI